MSLIGSTTSGPQGKSNESHQPTDPSESPRYQVDPGAKNEQRADKIQQPTNALGLHTLGSGKLSAYKIAAIVNRVAMSMPIVSL